MRRGDLYQYVLIVAGIIATILFSFFFAREIFPEYKIYQEDYIALEKFRSSYTGEPPPDFQIGVKQIVIEREDKGPPFIDRCTSCHVALQFPHFSPTKLAYDVNGNLVLDDQGRPVQIPNEKYVWKKLDEAIAALTDPQVNKQLEENGEGSQIAARKSQAEAYQALKTAQVGEHVYDVAKVLRMHPLIGRETRPFEYHSLEEFGCTTCHSGNGRGLTTEKAHGPVFDGQYDTEFMGPKSVFTEQDPDNDPAFARVFNDKPGNELLFQTTPLLVGSLIEAKCVNCHQDSQAALSGVAVAADEAASRREGLSRAINRSLSTEKETVISLLDLRSGLQKMGLKKLQQEIDDKANDLSLPEKEQAEYKSQYTYLESFKDDQDALENLDQSLQKSLGTEALADHLIKMANGKEANNQLIDEFLVEHRQDPGATGPLFTKADTLNLDEEIMRHVQDTQTSFEKAVNDQAVISAFASDVDLLTKNYHRGEQLYISQACYACHRIAGFARGGVGPELTRIGKSYPWYIKESIVWPQADLPTSTMPNYRMDHEDLEDLMTFLLGQVGERKAISEIAYKVSVQDWEAGKKLPWEKEIPAGQIKNVRYAMLVFATEGCSACHRLKGFESNVGFSAEKEKGEKVPFDALYKEKEWFEKLIPETIVGSDLVRILDQHAEEIDRRIVPDVRKGSIIEEIDGLIPGQVESLYTSFRYAARAKNHALQTQADQEKDPAKKREILKQLDQWKQRVHRVLMMFIQEYGFGRLICPRPNWSGVYRSDEWLMEHFRNPASHVPRSIMPVMPFDDTKFYALTYMLDVLGKRNRDEVREIWMHRGFNPQQAFKIHCAQCHGQYMQGNGLVAEWIYPIPKNLRNADFLRNLTKERVIQSITHGVKGTPMPPWGEAGGHKPMMDNIPVLSGAEIKQLVDWMFFSLPGGMVIKGSEAVPKWNYTPEDVLKELENEGNQLKGGKEYFSPEQSFKHTKPINPLLEIFPSGKGYYASLKPVASNEPSPQPENLKVADIFDVMPNPISGPDSSVFYIKKKFYTKDNIEQGDKLFQLNCAVCHGAEADGTGTRAGAMKDAKPRMLTNLDWSLTRDDLRLLRSIKYGVPGTAMTPWGDITSSLQRMQLVMYIRTLTQEQLQREELSNALYEVFESSILAVEDARIRHYPALAKAQESYNAFKNKRMRLYNEIGTDALPQDAVGSYQEELRALSDVKRQQEIDTILTNLKNEISQERNIYQGIGLSLLKLDDPKNFNDFLKIIQLNAERYADQNGKLKVSFDSEKAKQAAELEQRVVQNLDEMIHQAETKKTVVVGRIASSQRDQELTQITNEIDSNTKIRNRVISGLDEAKRSQQRQKILFDEFYSKIEPKEDNQEIMKK